MFPVPKDVQVEAGGKEFPCLGQGLVQILQIACTVLDSTMSRAMGLGVNLSE